MHERLIPDSQRGCYDDSDAQPHNILMNPALLDDPIFIRECRLELQYLTDNNHDHYKSFDTFIDRLTTIMNITSATDAWDIRTQRLFATYLARMKLDYLTDPEATNDAAKRW